MLSERRGRVDEQRRGPRFLMFCDNAVSSLAISYYEVPSLVVENPPTWVKLDEKYKQIMIFLIFRTAQVRKSQQVILGTMFYSKEVIMFFEMNGFYWKEYNMAPHRMLFMPLPEYCVWKNLGLEGRFLTYDQFFSPSNYIEGYASHYFTHAIGNFCYIVKKKDFETFSSYHNSLVNMHISGMHLVTSTSPVVTRRITAYHIFLKYSEQLGKGVQDWQDAKTINISGHLMLALFAHHKSPFDVYRWRNTVLLNYREAFESQEKIRPEGMILSESNQYMYDTKDVKLWHTFGEYMAALILYIYGGLYVDWILVTRVLRALYQIELQQKKYTRVHESRTLPFRQVLAKALPGVALDIAYRRMLWFGGNTTQVYSDEEMELLQPIFIHDGKLLKSRRPTLKTVIIEFNSVTRRNSTFKVEPTFIAWKGTKCWGLRITLTDKKIRMIMKWYDTHLCYINAWKRGISSRGTNASKGISSSMPRSIPFCPVSLLAPDWLRQSFILENDIPTNFNYLKELTTVEIITNV